MKAHSEGRLVLFVGAGASVARPSDLPLFGGLAGRVRDVLGLASDPSTSSIELPEKRLGDLARSGMNVHEAVRQIIEDSQESNDHHRAIAAFASVGQTIRILTTNYDGHLSRELTGVPTSDVVPDLSRTEINGVVHLHGAASNGAQGLVVTDDDVARAYFGDNPSALRFLQHLVRSFVVLFIGCSVEDVPLRYVLMSKRGETSLYALTPRPENDKWKELGITPVACGDYSEIPAVLDALTEFAAMTSEDHDRRIGGLARRPDGPAALSPQDESYLDHALDSPRLVLTLTDHLRGHRWLGWAADRRREAFSSLGSGRGDSGRLLRSWFAKRCADDDECAEIAIRLVRTLGEELDDHLWWLMYGPGLFSEGLSEHAAVRLLIALDEVTPLALRASSGRGLHATLTGCRRPVGHRIPGAGGSLVQSRLRRGCRAASTAFGGRDLDTAASPRSSAAAAGRRPDRASGSSSRHRGLGRPVQRGPADRQPPSRLRCSRRRLPPGRCSTPARRSQRLRPSHGRSATPSLEALRYADRAAPRNPQLGCPATTHLARLRTRAARSRSRGADSRSRRHRGPPGPARPETGSRRRST